MGEGAPVGEEVLLCMGGIMIHEGSDGAAWGRSAY